jgi:hypothetical protein
LVVGEEAPADLSTVRYAFRLGWAIAELRGRYQPDHYNQRDPGDETVFKRGMFQLPLASERSPAEIRKELIQAVEALSKQLELDKVESIAKSWEALKKLLDESEATEERQPLWSDAVKCFFQWDAHTQAALTLEATHEAGYQLGRGLAETYWALEPGREADEMGSWEFVLGERRYEILQRMAARLSSYLGASTVAAVEGPLADWSALARDPARRIKPEVIGRLFRQGLLWRDLIRGERQPADLQVNADVDSPPTAKVWSDLGLYREAFTSLRLPLLAGIAGIAALVIGAWLLASGASNSGLSAAISILGTLGVTSASLYARAKANATSLLANFNKEVEVERVRKAADLCPQNGEAFRRGHQPP